MSETVRGLIVTHASLAAAMVSAVGKICGEQTEALAPLSNEGRSPEALADAVAASLGDGPVILFTDLSGGSCSFVARKVALTRPETAFVSGLNVPMLVDFVFHREMPLDALVDRLVESGRNGIVALCPGRGHASRTAAS